MKKLILQSAWKLLIVVALIAILWKGIFMAISEDPKEGVMGGVMIGMFCIGSIKFMKFLDWDRGEED